MFNPKITKGEWKFYCDRLSGDFKLFSDEEILVHEGQAFQHIEQSIDQFHYGDKASELEELSHAATRCLMALQLLLERNK